jgi:hypothetical protein
VCADDAKFVVGLLRRDEGDERPAARDEASRYTASELGEFARGVEPYEASVEQPFCGGGYDVMRRGGCIKELTEVGDCARRAPALSRR